MTPESFYRLPPPSEWRDEPQVTRGDVDEAADSDSGASRRVSLEQALSESLGSVEEKAA